MRLSTKNVMQRQSLATFPKYHSSDPVDRRTACSVRISVDDVNKQMETLSDPSDFVSHLLKGTIFAVSIRYFKTFQVVYLFCFIFLLDDWRIDGNFKLAILKLNVDQLGFNKKRSMSSWISTNYFAYQVQFQVIQSSNS